MHLQRRIYNYVDIKNAQKCIFSLNFWVRIKQIEKVHAKITELKVSVHIHRNSYYGSFFAKFVICEANANFGRITPICPLIQYARILFLQILNTILILKTCKLIEIPGQGCPNRK